MTALSVHGVKHTCTHCSTRFYDMNKEPATCPKCSEPVPAAKIPVKRKRRSAGDSSDMTKHAVVATVVKPKPVKWKRGY